MYDSVMYSSYISFVVTTFCAMSIVCVTKSSLGRKQKVLCYLGIWKYSTNILFVSNVRFRMRGVYLRTTIYGQNQNREHAAVAFHTIKQYKHCMCSVCYTVCMIEDTENTQYP